MTVNSLGILTVLYRKGRVSGDVTHTHTLDLSPYLWHTWYKLSNRQYLLSVLWAASVSWTVSAIHIVMEVNLPLVHILV